LAELREGEPPEILILGYSYKPELGDVRETPVKELAKALLESGAKPKIWDPLVDSNQFPDWIEAIESPYQEKGIDVIVLATSHSEILEMDWKKLRLICRQPTIFDGRRVLDKEKFESEGWRFAGVGIPS
jgi:UDPglucose 6-dehydrogenase